ncbi:MAG: hypothetical protein EA428_15590 [Spirochaetaceae bacterium]|nr:MAG: hypothetical protein EA428_15590 [Spirochaetaceae bacterium]
MKNVESRGPQQLLILAILVFSLALAGTRTLSPAGLGDSIWPGFATFVVHGSYDLAELSSTLNAAGVDSYIGAETTRFWYNDFGPLSTVKLSDLESRFDQRDPRLDPYMQSVSNYFQVQQEGESYHVIYIPGDAATLMERIGPTLQERGVPLLNADTSVPDSMLLPILVFCAVLGSTIWSRRRAAFVLSAGLLLILATLGTGDPFGAAAGMLVYLSWVISYPGIMAAFGVGASEGVTFSSAARFRAQFRFLVIYLALAGIVALGMVLWYSPRALLSLLLTLAGIGAAATAGIAVEHRRRAMREHGVFEPIAILPERLRPHRLPGDLYLAPLGALLVLLLVPVASSENEMSIPALPQPVNTAERSDMVLNSVNETQLPTIEDYLAHRAFQEAFMYGWEFRLPERGEDLSIPEFERNNGRIERRDRVAFSFDEDWIAGELEAIGENEHLGIESMLLAAGLPNGVEYRPVRHVYWARSELIRSVIPAVLLLLVPVLVRIRTVFPTIDKGDRVTQLFYKRRNIEVV